MTQKRLTPEVVFGAEPLSGQIPQMVKLSPTGAYIAYLAPGADDRERMDLWRVEPDSEPSVWIDARRIAAGEFDAGRLTEAEKAERERQRRFTFGITQYSWQPRFNRLFVPVDGMPYLCGDPDADEPQFEALCEEGTRQSGFQFSPEGQYLSYVRNGDLYFRPVGEERAGERGEVSVAEVRVTHAERPTIISGLPDFIAAEEMHRFQGHWWSTDERYLVYTRTDEATVEISRRLEMDADRARTVEQRYPYTGAQNAAVSLHVYDIERGESVCVWRAANGRDASIFTGWDDGPRDAEYLARVTPCSGGLYVQTQDRRQQRLDLLRLKLDEMRWVLCQTELSETWINLTDDLYEFGDDRYVFTSERTGTRQLVVSDQSGAISITGGPTHINSVLGVNGTRIAVTGWDTTPIENHLFTYDVETKSWDRLTTTPGWHEIALDQERWCFIDRFSSDTTPVRVDVLEDSQPSRPLFREVIENGHPYAAYLENQSKPVYGETQADDGQKLYYRLTPPRDIDGQHAVIVYVYGGPGAQKVRREWSPLLLQMFADAGFGVLELDNRGSTNRGRTFEAPIYRQLGSIEVADQVKGLRVLDEFTWVDTSRLGIFGHSYGGYMTLMCLCQRGDLFRSGVAVAPVCDWHLYDTHYTERYLDLPESNPGGYAGANVLSHLENLDKPLLLMHGMADDNVLFTHSTMIMSRLQALGIPFELMTYPGAKHAMQERHVATHRFNAILDFFNRTL